MPDPADPTDPVEARLAGLRRPAADARDRSMHLDDLRRRTRDGLDWATAWCTSLGWARVAATALGLVIAALVGWWLLRPPPPPVEDLLPRAGAGEPVPTADVGAGAGIGGGAGSAAKPADAQELVVHVAGAVRRPGIQSLPPGSRVVDAVDAAGGPTRKADLDSLNLAAPLSDGQQVYVARRGGSGGSAATPSPGVVAVGPLDMRSATAEQLEALPGIGPALAAAILRHRDEVGPCVTIEDLLDVPGIGPATLEALRDLVRC